MNIHIRDFDDDLHALLVKKADAKGVSLSQFLRDEMAAIAQRPSMEEIFAKLHSLPRPNIPRDVVEKAMREAKDERDNRPHYNFGFAESDDK